MLSWIFQISIMNMYYFYNQKKKPSQVSFGNMLPPLENSFVILKMTGLDV